MFFTIVGKDGGRLYVFDVRVPRSPDVEQLDVYAHSRDEAHRKARVDADELYGTDATLTLVQTV